MQLSQVLFVMSAHDAGEVIISYAVLKDKASYKQMIQLEYSNDSLLGGELIQRNLRKLLKTPAAHLTCSGPHGCCSA